MRVAQLRNYEAAQEPVQDIGVSSFSSLKPLIGLRNKLARNSHEYKIAREAIPGKALNLTLVQDDPMGKSLADIRQKYTQDFKAAAAVDSRGPARIVHDGLEVTQKEELNGEDEYRAMLAQYNERAARHEADEVQAC